MPNILTNPNAKLLTQFTEMFDTKQITTLVAAVLPLAEAGRAHETIERHQHPSGKIALQRCGGCKFARLERAVAEARLRVPIAAVYPLPQAAKAHGRLERGHLLGRIELQIRRGTS